MEQSGSGKEGKRAVDFMGFGRTGVGRQADRFTRDKPCGFIFISAKQAIEGYCDGGLRYRFGK